MKTILYVDHVSFKKEELCKLLVGLSNVCFVVQNNHHLETVKQCVLHCVNNMETKIDYSFNLLEDLKRNHLFLTPSFL